MLLVQSEPEPQQSKTISLGSSHYVSRPLYEIAGDIEQAVFSLEDIINNTELSEAEKAAGIDEILARLDTLGEDAGAKVEQCVHVIREKQNEAEAQKREIDRLEQRKRVNEACIKRLKEYTLECVKRIGGRYKTPLENIAIGHSERLVVLDEQFIPPEYYKKQEPVLDKNALKADIKAGLVTEGARIDKTKYLKGV